MRAHRRGLIAAVVIIVATVSVAVGLYLLNPFGTATLDPRARLTGWTVYSAESSAMMPTIRRGDVVVVNVAAYAKRDPQLRDIIVAKPLMSDTPNILRVVATAGDRVAIVDGRLRRNGELVDEPFVARSPHTIVMPEVAVLDGQFYLVADNRDTTNDSRFWGTVGRGAVVGRAVGVWRVSEPLSFTSLK